jgi:DNA-directed RNA polymerase alpha subunit
VTQTPIPKIGGPFNAALTEAGYTHLEQLTEVTAAELLKLHGVGQKGIRMLREAMAEKGLALKGE